MKFDKATRAKITLTVTTDFDPGAATVELGVDGTWYPATWISRADYTPVKNTPQWTRRAQTDGYFAGPGATPAGAVVLAAGTHTTQARVTSGGQVVAAASTTIEVG